MRNLTGVSLTANAIFCVASASAAADGCSPREPHVGARVGRDLALIDLGRANDAQLDLTALKDLHPDRVDVLEGLGLADETLGNYIDMLADAEALLEREPGHPGGLRLRYRALLGAGAPELARAVWVSPNRGLKRPVPIEA